MIYLLNSLIERKKVKIIRREDKRGWDGMATKDEENAFSTSNFCNRDDGGEGRKKANHASHLLH
jgi:hypothetical protein